MPHFFGLDFSAALPWVLMGFVAGLVLTWLWRSVSGSTVQRAELLAALADVERLRAEQDNTVSSLARLKGDYGFLGSALADAESRAAKALQVQAELADANRSGEQARAAADAAAEELAKLTQQIAMYASHSKTLEQRLQYYNAENTAISTASETRARELEALRKEAADLRAASDNKDLEAARQKTEIASFKARLAELSAAQAEGDNHDAELQRLRGELQSFGDVLTAAEQGRKDLGYFESLASWSSNEVYRLRKLLSDIEAAAATKSARIAALEKQIGSLKGRGLGKGRFGLGGRVGQTTGRSVNGAAHHPLPMKPKRKAAARAASLKRAGQRKPDQALPAGRVWLVANRPVQAQGAGSTGDQSDVAALKSRVATLSAEIENYRRFRDALAEANRIVGGGS